MDVMTKKIVVGATIGLLSAIIVDIRKWRKSKQAFNWTEAIGSWTEGTLAGLVGALAVSEI